MTATLHDLAAHRKPQGTDHGPACPTCLARAVRADLAAQVTHLRRSGPVDRATLTVELADVLAGLDVVLATVDATNRHRGITD